MFKAVSRKAFICPKCFCQLAKLSSNLINTRPTIFPLIPRANSSTAAAIAQKPIRQDPISPLAKNESGSQSYSHRGSRLRRNLRAKKRTVAKSSVQKRGGQKPRPAEGSLRKLYPYSIRRGGRVKTFKYGRRAETVSLGIKALGQPAKAVIVEEQTRPPPSANANPTSEAGPAATETDTLLGALSTEDELLNLEEVQAAINQLKATYARKKTILQRKNWTDLRRKMRDSFQKEQLLQFIKEAKEDIVRDQAAPTQPTKEPSPTLSTLSEQSKSKIAEYIMTHILGLTQRSGRTDELKLAPYQSQLISRLNRETLASLEEEYGAKIDLITKGPALRLHYDKEDKESLQANHEEAYERLSQMCRDISTRTINLSSEGKTIPNVNFLLKKSYLEHISRTHQVFVEVRVFHTRDSGVQKQFEKRDLRIHYLNKLHGSLRARRAERDVLLAFHEAAQRSTSYRWWTKANQPVPVPISSPENYTWHQERLKWSRLVLSGSTENEGLLSSTDLSQSAVVSNGVLGNIDRQVSKGLYSQISWFRDAIYLGHLLMPIKFVPTESKPAMDRTETKGLLPLTANVPLLPHVLSSFEPHSVSSSGLEEGRPQRDRAFFVPSPFCTGDLPSFELVLTTWPTDRFRPLISSMTATFQSTVIDIPLPQHTCDLRLVRQYGHDLTPEAGYRILHFLEKQQKETLPDYQRPLESLVAHLADSWDVEKKRFSFPPILDLAVPNAWVRKRAFSTSEKRSDKAELTPLSDSKTSALNTEDAQDNETTGQKTFHDGTAVPDSACSRFTYLCATSNPVNEAVFYSHEYQGRLRLSKYHDSVSQKTHQELFLRGRKNGIEIPGGSDGTRVRSRQALELILAEALKLARVFGREMYDNTEARD